MYANRYVVAEKRVGDFLVAVYHDDTDLFLYEILNHAGSIILLVDGFIDPDDCLREGVDLAQYEDAHKRANG